MIDKTPFSDNLISVSEVNATIKACIDAPIFRGLEVFGEISGYKLSGQHAYFNLKDKDSQLSCVCFNAAKTYMPKDGESVILKGNLDYYTKGGRLSLQVSLVTPIGQGLLFLEFERLKAKLFAEGLFDDAHKKPIPPFAKNVCVVTSKTGAVISDIVTTIRRKNPCIDIVLKDVRVQGGNAGHEIAAVLSRIDKLGFDVIILARGGGSLEDLAPFYDEELVRAIYHMQTPIVSAIGHETDFSLADFVSDYRAATPTAAAELVAFDYFEIYESIIASVDRMKKLIVWLFERGAMKVKLSSQNLQHLAKGFYIKRSHIVSGLLDRMKNCVSKKFDLSEYRLLGAVGSLDNLSPLKTLSRGYFTLQIGEKSITKIKSLSIGDKITVIGADGNVTANVCDIKVFEENGNGREQDNK